MEVQISDLFDLQIIADSGQCFRAAPHGDGWRFIAGGRVLDIRKTGGETYDAACSPEDWTAFWRPYFDLDRDYRSVTAAIPPEDRFLRRAADYGAGVRVLRQEPWETLMTFIVSQRKSIPAIRAVVEELSRRYGSPLDAPDGTVYAFPTAEQLRDVSETDFRALRAGYRAPYLRDAVERVLSDALDLDAVAALPDGELLAALQSVRGVGVKVASCTALFAYGRTACAPIDTWIDKVIRREYGGKAPFARYGDGAGIMQQYFFYYALGHKGEKWAAGGK